jgi:hypothetical protein
MMDVYAYYYPGFYQDDYRITGTEWNVLKKALPRNKDHYQPRVPVNGYYDQADLQTCKEQIQLAQKYGINGFMICYYWDFESSKPIMNKPLDCLMDALIGTNFKFNLMWVLRLPHKELPIKNGDFGKYSNHPWFKKRIQLFFRDENFINSVNKISQHPNYRLDKDRKPFFQIYSVSELLLLHGKEETKNILNIFNNYHLQGVCGRDDEWIGEAEKLKLNSVTSYVTLVNFNSNKSILKHSECVNNQAIVWENIINATNVPYYPSVSSGWDASPRGEFIKNFQLKKFPWSPIVIDANPSDFYLNLKNAVETFSKNNVDLHIASWNEWSEGHYIEPDLKYGTQFLEKIKIINTK